MLETILLIVVTAGVFGLFFLVFLFKGTTSEPSERFHSCAKCNCHKNDTSKNPTGAAAATAEPCRADPGGTALMEP